MTVRIALGVTEPIEAKFVDAAGVGVAGLSPTVVLWRRTGSKFYNGSGYSAAPPGSPLAMTAVDATNLPGEYVYAFDTSAGATEEKHFFTCATTSGTVANQKVDGEFDIGGSPGLIQLANDAISAGKIATAAIDADAIAADAGIEIGTAVWASTTRTLTSIAAVADAQGATALRLGYLDNLDALVSSLETEVAASLRASANASAHSGTLAAVEGVQEDLTDNVLPVLAAVDSRLPADPADQSLLIDAIGAIPLAPDSDAIADAVWAAVTRTLTAGNGISVDLVDGAISELTMDLDALAMIRGEVQAGLTVQGYTPQRAFALDNLNASSQSIVDGQTDTLVQVALVFQEIVIAKQWLRGHVVETGTGPWTFTLYEDNTLDTILDVVELSLDKTVRMPL